MELDELKKSWNALDAQAAIVEMYARLAQIKDL